MNPVADDGNQEAPHAQKFETLKERTLWGVLDSGSREFVRHVSNRYRLTFQEIRQLSLTARDLEMWQQPPIVEWWRRIEELAPSNLSGPQLKKHLLGQLNREIDELRSRPKSYPAAGLPQPERAAPRVVTKASDKTILGDCPVASERTLCCNLKTIDAVENCAFGCSYCTIQTFYGDDAALDDRFGEKLRDLQLDPARFHHVTSGQSSDSLVWGNKNGILDDLCDFAARHPNVLLELKTKSANVAYFLQHAVPPNVMCAWSLNTATIVDNEEHFTASLDRRLSAARKVADRGVKVAFHFHPIVYYRGWAEEYRALAARVLETFSFDEVLFVSFGSVTFIKPVLRQIRKRGGITKILQMRMVPDPHGKLSYPDDIKLRLFRTLYEAFSPWHEDVFMYLCMERPFFWDEVFGRRYDSNEEFEADFGARTMEKVNRGSGGRS